MLWREEGGGEASEEEPGVERGGSSSSSSSWKAGLVALVAAGGGGGAATASAAPAAVVHFLRPTPLATRPGPGSFQSSAALKSSWIKRLRGLQGEADPPVPAPVPATNKEIVAAEGARNGKGKVVTSTAAAGMDSDTRMGVLGSGISGPAGPSGGPTVRPSEPIVVSNQQQQHVQQPGRDLLASRRQRGGGASSSHAGRGVETMILSRRGMSDAALRRDSPLLAAAAGASEAGENVVGRDSATNVVRSTATKVTFAPSTKDSEQRRTEPRKRPAPEGEFRDRHPFRFSQMDTVLEGAAGPGPDSGGFGIFRLNPVAAPGSKPMWPPSKKGSMGSFAFSTSDRNDAPTTTPPPATGSSPAPAAPPPPAAAGPPLPPKSAEMTLWRPRTEKKPTFQLLKSDITNHEETERLQRRNGQLLESMLANRQAEKEKELFGAARAAAGGLEGLPPRSGYRIDGGQTSGFVSYVKKLQYDGTARTGEALGKASTSYQPGTSFDALAAEGMASRGSRQRGKMRQVFQDTEMEEPKPSQRHADTLSRLWQGIAEQPSLLTPLFAPYKPVDEGLGDPMVAEWGSNKRDEQPSPLTPLFRPFKVAQDDASQARRMDRPPLPRRVDPSSSGPFTFTATGKRPAAASFNMAPPSSAAAAVPKDAGRDMSQEMRGEGSRTHRPNASGGNPNKVESLSSHYSNSPWLHHQQEDTHFGGLQHDESGSRSNAQGFGAANMPSAGTRSPNRPTAANGSVRGFRHGSENDEGYMSKRKNRDPPNLGEGGPSVDPRAAHAWVPEAIGQPLLQRYTAEPGDSSGSTLPLLPPESGLGMEYAGFGVLGPIEPLIMPSQSLQARGGESESQVPSSSKVPKITDNSFEPSSRRGQPLEVRERGGSSMFDGRAGQGIFGEKEKSSKPVRRNVLNEVEAEGPSYVSSRTLHQNTSKRRTFSVQPPMADDIAEDGDQTLRPTLSQSWINRWLPANSALPSCQPSNSKSPARPPGERARTNPVRNSPQRSSGNVRVTSYCNFDQPGGSRRRDRGHDRGHSSDNSRGLESGRDRWFHAPSETGSPPGSGPSAAALAIVGRALRNLTSAPPGLWRQGASGMWPADSQQASASGPSEQQPR